MNLWAHFLDWFYPPQCSLCDIPLAGGRHLCPDCRDKLPALSPVRCRTCAHPFDGHFSAPEQCPSCAPLKPAFDFATAAVSGNDQSIRLIHEFKLLKHPEIAPALAALAAEAFRQEPRLANLASPLLIPVPLHRARLRQRGFNQAEELVRTLSRLLAIPSTPALVRVIDTPRQATLTRSQRLKNLKKAFQLHPRRASLLAGRDLILVDDVFTTGSTVHECARVLRKAHPSSVAVLTVVRA